ncbi:diguanylate cyclase domain-containing protein [candidate division CSSED10-310 bacterium]|uniref:Diguanylate cyclase domain-containing protein n=1 Tax=candidate division CSSED10-310 bacterium TaxID=2855610 RepID=A0ABV6YS14_UNCC1
MITEKQVKPTILIVDDTPANIRILVAGLQDDYDIFVATNGPDALEIVTSDSMPDLILLDIVMPGMDGYEVCHKLKNDVWTRNIPIIFITAMNQVDDETKGLEIGAVDYITKPFSMAIVRARIKTHLELKHHRDMLENLSFLDGLTAIPNRRRFDQLYPKMWEHSVQKGASLAVIMIDIDFFKAYNDNYGHLAGDDCLKCVAQTLNDSMNLPKTFVARYGGEEFISVLPQFDYQNALSMAEALRQNIAALHIPHSFSGVEPFVSISLGVAALNPTNASSPSVLLEAADKALYEAKKEARNIVRGIDLNEL